MGSRFARFPAPLAFVLLACLPASAQLRPDVTAKPQKSGQIVIESSPHAEVYLDDVLKGHASQEGELVIGSVKPGEHTLRVSLAGKQDYETTVRVLEGRATTIKAALTNLSGNILVHSSPGAAVFLNGSRRGSVEGNGLALIADVTPGSHQLRVTAPGKRDFQQYVTVTAGQEVEVHASLAALAGSLRLRTAPGANVFLDNSSRGGTADATGQIIFTDVPPGSHQVHVTFQGKQNFERSVTVTVGQEATVDAPLVDVEDASTHFRRAEGLFYGKDMDGAIAEYRAALRLKPDYAVAHFGLGSALMAKGDLDGAIAEYQEVLRLNPDNAGARAMLSDALERKGGQAGSQQPQEPGQATATGTSGAGSGTSEDFSVRHYHGALSPFYEDGSLRVAGGRVRYSCTKDERHEFDVPVDDVEEVKVTRGGNPYSMGFLDRMVVIRLRSGQKYSFVCDKPERIRSAIIRAKSRE